MTTIATDGRSMAGDGQAGRGDLITRASAVKVHRLADGSLFGGAGDAGQLIDLRAWLEGGGARPKAKSLAAFHLKTNGELWYYGDNESPVLSEAPNAVGTGEALAIGAMEAGATPEQAVAIAARRDINSGGAITVLHLHGLTLAEPAARAVA